ncbi:hypothetical protein DM194_27740 (plasmid) [Azospirillum ramasamyi]|uniref:Uncharacterized protein n=1 Tax=Azospirillum ramasamyi TaxID=682998 RepID=A0A2U9SEX3_9PROT|nr:hypothetical protein DM194_27740 [Azospirillum ramasamyi]
MHDEVVLPLRNHLRNPQFLIPGSEPMADRIGSELERIRRLDRADRRTRVLAAGMLEWMLKRGGEGTSTSLTRSRTTTWTRRRNETGAPVRALHQIGR